MEEEGVDSEPLEFPPRQEESSTPQTTRICRFAAQSRRLAVTPVGTAPAPSLRQRLEEPFP
jgi:hypothetical protein